MLLFKLALQVTESLGVLSFPEDCIESFIVIPIHEAGEKGTKRNEVPVKQH